MAVAMQLPQIADVPAGDFKTADVTKFWGDGKCDVSSD